MWLDEQFGGGQEAELPFLGRVTAVNGGRAEISGRIQLADVRCVSAFGVEALPSPGDEVLVLPAREGYLCAGSVRSGEEGGLCLRVPSGAFLELRADGSISLNGAVITREGQFLPREEGERKNDGNS